MNYYPYTLLMLTDAHCHPYYLSKYIKISEQKMKITAAASACELKEFLFIEKLSEDFLTQGNLKFLPCFAVHPQMPVYYMERGEYSDKAINEKIELTEKLAFEKRIAAVGECGFDLFNNAFKETEALQDKIFSDNLDISVKFSLPVILHVRHAMHKIFPLAGRLKKCKAVIFHSWSGSFEEGMSLLHRGVNAYFSIGNSVLNGRKQTRKSCALLPAQRLLTETDAPYQNRQGCDFSQWLDLPLILEAVSSLRMEEGEKKSPHELESRIEENFKNIFF